LGLTPWLHTSRQPFLLRLFKKYGLILLHKGEGKLAESAEFVRPLTIRLAEIYKEGQEMKTKEERQDRYIHIGLVIFCCFGFGILIYYAIKVV